MSHNLAPLINKITTNQPYESAEMREAFTSIMSGEVSAAQIAAFLVGLKMRGETPSDIAAGAQTLRAMATIITAPEGAIDIVGTGGDGVGTYNISTATAFVLAGAGVTVAKHGNRAVSSKSGAADILTSLGVNLDCDFGLLEAALDEAGVCFLMAPRHHAAMRHVGPIRAELGTRTIFNLLGPLSNPALVSRLMVGVYDEMWLRPFAEALHQLGTTHAMIVHGSDGLDEATITGPTYAVMLQNGTITEHEFHPADCGISIATIADIKGGTPDENAAALRALLNNEADASNAYRDITLFNAALAMIGTGHETDLTAAFARASESLSSCAAQKALSSLISVTNRG
ncbi:MAG: anthranilate phosphoribosyltransferase [Candidatus Puniceispirillaceae bacterium]